MAHIDERDFTKYMVSSTIYMICLPTGSYDTFYIRTLGWCASEDEAKKVVKEINDNKPTNPFNKKQLNKFNELMSAWDDIEEVMREDDPNCINEFIDENARPMVTDTEKYAVREREIEAYMEDHMYEWFATHPDFPVSRETIEQFNRYESYVNDEVGEAYYEPVAKMTYDQN